MSVLKKDADFVAVCVDISGKLKASTSNCAQLIRYDVQCLKVLSHEGDRWHAKALLVQLMSSVVVCGQLEVAGARFMEAWPNTALKQASFKPPTQFDWLKGGMKIQSSTTRPPVVVKSLRQAVQVLHSAQQEATGHRNTPASLMLANDREATGLGEEGNGICFKHPFQANGQAGIQLQALILARPFVEILFSLPEGKLLNLLTMSKQAKARFPQFLWAVTGVSWFTAAYCECALPQRCPQRRTYCTPKSVMLKVSTVLAEKPGQQAVHDSLRVKSGTVLTTVANVLVRVFRSIKNTGSMSPSNSELLRRSMTASIVAMFMVTHLHDHLSQSLCCCSQRANLAVHDLPAALDLLLTIPPRMKETDTFNKFILAVKKAVTLSMASKRGAKVHSQTTYDFWSSLSNADVSSLKSLMHTMERVVERTHPSTDQECKSTPDRRSKSSGTRSHRDKGKDALLKAQMKRTEKPPHEGRGHEGTPLSPESSHDSYEVSENSIPSSGGGTPAVSEPYSLRSELKSLPDEEQELEVTSEPAQMNSLPDTLSREDALVRMACLIGSCSADPKSILLAVADLVGRKRARD